MLLLHSRSAQLGRHICISSECVDLAFGMLRGCHFIVTALSAIDNLLLQSKL